MAYLNGQIVDTTKGAMPSSFKPKASLPPSFKPKAAVAPDPGPSPDAVSEARLGGALSGVTRKFLDEAAGVRNAVKGTVLPVALGGSDKPIGQLYTEGRDKVRGMTERARAGAPETFERWELGGSVLSPVPGNAAVSAGLDAFGGAEGDLGDQALQTGAGVVTGLTVDKVLGGLGRKLKGGKLTQWLGAKGDELIGKVGGLKEAAKQTAVPVLKSAGASAVGSAISPQVGAMLGAGNMAQELVSSPAVRGLAAKGTEKVLQGVGATAEKAVRPTALEAVDDERMRSLVEWLRRGR